MIYFIRTAESGVVKIGMAEDVASRFPCIQTCHHEKLTLIRTVEGGPREELWLHRHFDHLHVRGEWFRFSEEMLTVEVPEIAPPPPPEFVVPLLGSIERFCAERGISAAEFGKRALGDPTFVYELRNGREPRRATRQRAEQFMAGA